MGDAPTVESKPCQVAVGEDKLTTIGSYACSRVQDFEKYMRKENLSISSLESCDIFQKRS
jgi:hypothetical protein